MKMCRENRLTADSPRTAEVGTDENSVAEMIARFSLATATGLAPTASLVMAEAAVSSTPGLKAASVAPDAVTVKKTDGKGENLQLAHVSRETSERKLTNVIETGERGKE